MWYLPCHTFFYLGLTFILMHEMDAVRCREWRIFPGLSALNEKWGFRIFMLAHIPLYFFLFSALIEEQKEALIDGLNFFYLIHFGLHLIFIFHPKNEFKDWISWTLIAGAGLFGMLDLFTCLDVSFAS